MIIVRDVHINLEDWPVLQGIDLSIAQGEIVCLLGPSGCGKTTMLRVIAGLERPHQGDIFLEGASILPIPVHQRRFGLMFQDHALFPHMTVAGNIAYGLRMQGTSDIDVKQRIGELLDLVNLKGFEGRKIAGLSGGERQRVALARSLAPGPRFLMLDEPMGSLDAALRAELITELRAIIKHTGLTALYVTHDQQEAFAIADRLAIMNAGRIEQIGSPDHVFRRPETVFSAMFLGLSNIFPAERLRAGSQASGDFSKLTNSGLLPSDVMSDNECKAFLLHPDFMAITAVEEGDLVAQVIGILFAGSAYHLEVNLQSNSSLRVRIPVSSSVPDMGAKIGLRLLPECAIALRR